MHLQISIVCNFLVEYDLKFRSIRQFNSSTGFCRAGYFETLALLLVVFGVICWSTCYAPSLPYWLFSRFM